MTVTDPGGNLLHAELDALRRAYAAQLPDRIGSLVALWHELVSAWDDEVAKTLHRMAHSLIGSGATYGFATISHTARLLERALVAIVERGRPLLMEQQTEVGALLEALQKACAVASPTFEAPAARPRLVTPAPPLSQPNRLIFVLSCDPALMHHLAAQIGYFGYTVHNFAPSANLDAALLASAPAALIVDCAWQSGSAEESAVIRSLQPARERGIPLLFISSQGDFAARLQAVRAGADSYFTRPIAISSLIDRLDRLVAPPATEPYRILIVEDEPDLAAYHALILQQAGMTTTIVTDPLHVMQPLVECTPDLILMDLYMPTCSGLEVAAVIRQQEAFVSIPIVFLSAETNVDKQLSAMQLGGDDFLTKPIQPDHLISAVTSRVQRSRTLRSFMVRDSLTGLLNHTRIKEQLSLEVARARRQQSQLTLAMIDIDHFKKVNDTYGHPAGDRVIKSLARLLQQRLRKTDAIGRYGGEEFVVILPDTPSRSAMPVLDEIRASFAGLQHQVEGGTLSVTISCGSASYPGHSDVTSLIQCADEALYAAKRGGRNQVVMSNAGNPNLSSEHGNVKRL